MTRPSPDSNVPTAALGRLVREGSVLLVAVVADDGRIAQANPAMARACGGDVEGSALEALLTPQSHQALRAHVEAGSEHGLLVQLTPPDAQPFSLRVFVERRAAGFALVGEPPWEDHRALEAQLHALNTELAELSREHARKARLLQDALAELRDSHWQLEKIGDVLPMCVECRAVRTTPSTWEDVSDFLIRTASFLSHGYCARCAAALGDDGHGER